MQAFTVRIELGNIAMCNMQQVAHALRYEVAKRLDDGFHAGNISDGNGNTVGRFETGEPLQHVPPLQPARAAPLQEVRDALFRLMTKAGEHGHKDAAWVLRAQIDKLDGVVSELRRAPDPVPAGKPAAGKPRSKARPAVLRPTLNCLGKPMSPLFDPTWKRKTPLSPISRLYGSTGNIPKVSPEQWTAMCRDAAAAWQKFMTGEAKGAEVRS